MQLCALDRIEERLCEHLAYSKEQKRREILKARAASAFKRSKVATLSLDGLMKASRLSKSDIDTLRKHWLLFQSEDGGYKLEEWK